MTQPTLMNLKLCIFNNVYVIIYLCNVCMHIYESLSQAQLIFASFVNGHMFSSSTRLFHIPDTGICNGRFMSKWLCFGGNLVKCVTKTSFFFSGSLYSCIMSYTMEWYLCSLCIYILTNLEHKASSLHQISHGNG